MSEHVKANPVAHSDKAPVTFSSNVMFVDGSPLTPESGGVVVDNGQHYAVADPSLVPNGKPSQSTGASWEIPANRTGRLTILEHQKSLPTTYGAELEAARMHPDGTYAALTTKEQHEINELYNFMVESGTPVTDSPDAFREHYWTMVHELVAGAEAAGQLVGALATYGQVEPTPEQVNSSIYVVDVEEAMTARTGFQTYRIFRIGSGQGHTGISNTEAGIKAAEAMEYLAPVLLPPTLAGTEIVGGMAADLSNLNPTPEQQAHMNRARIIRDDLSGPYQSQRTLLRILGSPSAGIWTSPPPDGLDAYIGRAHDQLRTAEINNFDRTNGWHTSRVRVVLDGKSGANTIEDCSADTALGNPETNVPLYLLRSALTTTFEAMAIEGRDPRLAVAHLLGTTGLTRQGRLNRAHALTLREAARYGNEATVYGRNPKGWLNSLFEIADEAPHTRLTEPDKQRLRGMFALQSEVAEPLRQWCRENRTDTPTSQAYFDLNLGNPAIYMRQQYEALLERGLSPEQATRQVELGAAQALHQTSARQQSASPKKYQDR